MLMWIARLYLWRWLPGGKRALFYSINVMRARHPPGSERIWNGSSVYWQLAPSDRALPSKSPSTTSRRHTDVSKRVVSRASSSCVRTSHREVTGCRLSASRAPLLCSPRPEGQRQPVHCFRLAGPCSPERTIRYAVIPDLIGLSIVPPLSAYSLNTIVGPIIAMLSNFPLSADRPPAARCRMRILSLAKFLLWDHRGIRACRETSTALRSLPVCSTFGASHTSTMLFQPATARSG